jgi:hypothetical protein
MKWHDITSTIEPLPETPGAAQSALSLQTLRDMEKRMADICGIPPRLLMPRSSYSVLREQAQSFDDLFVRPLVHSYLGLSTFQLPDKLFRPADKPLRSRPRWRTVRAARRMMKADRPRLRQLTRAYHCQVFKTRKVPDRRGYPPNSCWLVNFSPYA